MCAPRTLAARIPNVWRLVTPCSHRVTASTGLALPPPIEHLDGVADDEPVEGGRDGGGIDGLGGALEVAEGAGRRRWPDLPGHRWREAPEPTRSRSLWMRRQARASVA
jgi:hypothetical protein